MTLLQALVALGVALIGAVGGGFAFAEFLIKRKDAKESNTIEKKIAEAVEEAKREVREEFEKGLHMRGEEGKERFEINSKQIEQNTAQIAEILTIVRDQASKYDAMAESITALNKVVEASAESQRNSNYDRLLIVANGAIKKRQITITEKTNLKQLYTSWKKLRGDDPKIETMYEECMKFTPVPDE